MFLQVGVKGLRSVKRASLALRNVHVAPFWKGRQGFMNTSLYEPGEILAMNSHRHDDVVREVWRRLMQIRHLRFAARTRVATGWHGDGSGRVVPEQAAPDTLHTTETGTWQPPAGPPLPFRNVYRWTRRAGRLRLDHLRHGPEAPVYLFDLIPDGPDALRAAAPHVCNDDLYVGTLRLTPDALILLWTIHGPHKDERITYHYT